MKQWLGLGISLLFSVSIKAQGLPSIGNWRDHLPLRNVLALEITDRKVDVASAYGLFTYEPDTRAFSSMSRGSGLSEVHIKAMSFSPLGKKRLVVYENSNLDLIEGEKIINIPDIWLSRTASSKKINQVCWDGETAYLASDPGIIVLDTERRLVKTTYKPLPGGGSNQITQVAILENQLFAATPMGLLSCSLNENLLADSRNWRSLAIQGSTIPPALMAVWNKKLLAVRGDSIYSLVNDSWILSYVSKDPVTFIQPGENFLLVGTSLQNKGAVLRFTSFQFPPDKIESALLTFPTAGAVSGNVCWTGDRNNGLIKIEGARAESIMPEAPSGIPRGQASFSGGKIFASAGYVSAAAVPEKIPGTIDVFEMDGWRTLNGTVIPQMDSLPDIMQVVADPVSKSTLAGSYGGGLIQISPENKTTIFKYGSPVAPALNDPSSFLVSGIAFDRDNQLWVLNPGTLQPLLLRKPDGNWKKFNIPLPVTGEPSSIAIDLDNRKWIIVRRGGGLICFDDGGTPDQLSDDRWRLFRQGRGNGNLPSSTVLSVAADKNGFIWVGTDRGIAIIQCGEDLFSPGLCEATLPIVKQDNFAGLLLAEEYVSDIAVDQADRKWVATQNGVWLLAPDGQKTIHRFTRSNSKLLDDEVFSVVIQDNTGEVFFLTRSGISSFRSTATAPAVERRKPFIFPNPVNPDYSGTIAFRDLPDRAWVKITDLNGKLVHETRSLGGQAVWDGKHLQGKRVNSGVYLVYVADEPNQMQLAGKVVFIK